MVAVYTLHAHLASGHRAHRISPDLRASMTSPLVDIVDDDPGTQKLLRLLAEQAGCRVRTHAAAASALAAMRDDPPAIAVIDVQLPGSVDGLAVIAALRSAPETAGVAVVVVSAFASLADETRARAAGCDVWMSKPIDTRALRRSLVRLGGAPEQPTHDGDAR